MPFRRKSRNAVSRPEKENAAVAEPLSPRLIRCRSDNTQRTCSELSLNKSLMNQDGALSAEAKMSNLMQLNQALVKEVASLRIFHADAGNKLAQVELGLRSENDKLQSNLSCREKELSSLREERNSLLASQEQLQSSLTTSLAQAEYLSQELAMVKADLNQALLIEKTALAASEERLLSANCDIERLRFSSKTLTEEIVALREETTLIASEKDRLLREKVEASMKEAALAASCERVCELEKLFNAEKKAGLDARSEFDLLDKELKKLFVEKEEAACRESSLLLQIEEERAQHQLALQAAKDEFCLKLSEACTEGMALEKLLQQSNGKVDSLSMQLQKEKRERDSEVCCLQEQLTDFTVKAKAMDELLQERMSHVDSLNQKVMEEAAMHQREKTLLQEKMSAMAAEISSSAAEYQKLAAKKDNLHKELSRVNQKQRQSNEHLAREKKSAAEAQKFVREVERDLKQARLVRDKTFEEFHLLKDKFTQLSNEKDALLADKQTLLEGIAGMEAQISSLHTEKGKISEHLSAAQKAHALDKQGFLAEIKKMESAISDLEVDQSDLLKQLNVEKMAIAAAQETIATLESTQQALLQERFEMRCTFSEQVSAKEKALVAAEDRVSSLSNEVQKLHLLNSELVNQAASLTEQLTHMESLKNGVDAEMQKVLAETKKINKEMAELISSKQTLQEKLLTDRADAMEEISSLEREINGLEQMKSSLANDKEQSREELAVLKEEKHQLEVLVSELNLKLEGTAAEKAQQLSEMEQLRKELDKLRAANSELVSSVKLYESQTQHWMSEKKKKEEHLTSLRKLYADLETSHTALKNDLATQKAAGEALADDNVVLQNSVETKAKALVLLEKQLDDSVKSTLSLESHVEAMAGLLRSLQEDFNAEKVEKAFLSITLETKNGELERLEEELRDSAAKIATVSSQLESNMVNCSREATKFEADFNEASKRVSLLEAQLSAKATMQNELEFQVLSLKNDLHAAQTASEKAEKEWKASMDTALDNADAKSKALEEQLESVKKTLCDMQNSANRGQESIASLQTQLSCLMEEKSSLEKKALSTNCRSIRGAKPDNAREEETSKEGSEEEDSKKAMDEKSKKLVRLVLPVFLITTASSLVFAGIQGYIGRPDY